MSDRTVSANAVVESCTPGVAALAIGRHASACRDALTEPPPLLMHGVVGLSVDMFASMFVCMHTTLGSVAGALPLREEKGDRPNEEHRRRERVTGEDLSRGGITGSGVLSAGVFSWLPSFACLHAPPPKFIAPRDSSYAEGNEQGA